MSPSRPVDPLGAAFELYSQVKRSISDELGKEFYGKVKEVAEMTEKSGLVPTISFLYSMRENFCYRLILKVTLTYLRMIGSLNPYGDVDSIIENPDAIAEEMGGLIRRSKEITPVVSKFLSEFSRICEGTWGLKER